MRIEDLVATPIALGDPPLLNAAGLHAPWALRIVLELRCENGVTGLGEVPGSPESLAAFAHCREAIRGARLTDLHAIEACVLSALGPGAEARGELSFDQRHRVHIHSAIEVACLDALGKSLGLRVVDLLGGPTRSAVPFAAYLFFKLEGSGGSRPQEHGSSEWSRVRHAEARTPETILQQAHAMADAFGFPSFKLKAGILPPVLESDTVLALREEFGPEPALRIDPNAAWSYPTALEQAARLRGVIEYLEDPVRGQEPMARFRREAGIPLATNMCTTSFADLPSSIRLGSEDVILCDHHFWGGLRACMDLSRICSTFGRGISMHSNSHAGISMAAMIALGSLLPEPIHDLDTHYPWQEDEVILGGKLPLRDGCAAIPEGPGLGVELDGIALAGAHQRYLQCGLTRRDDEAQMQKVDPDWKFLATRY